jgi:DNA-binding HxlR family transcriptional regulator
MARANSPVPGAPVRGSTTGRPIMAALDLLGRRWTLRLIWELRGGPMGFRALQARCEGMSPSVLSQRLSELVESGVVAQNDTLSYGLTRRGDELLQALTPLNDWAARWARESTAP